MSLVVRAFPLRSSVEELRDFATTLNTRRKAETDAFYRRFGISHESWHLQNTENGPWVISVTMIDNPTERAHQYAQAAEEFEGWFKGRVRALSGVNPNEQPLGPPTTQEFSWPEG